MVSKKEYTLKELASHLPDANVVGDPDCVIHSLASLDRAKQGALSYFYDKRYKSYLANTQASAVILAADFVSQCPTHAITTADPRRSWATIAGLFSDIPAPSPGVDPSVEVGERCRIPSTASVGAYSVLGNDVTIGEHAVIGPHCVIGRGVQIGNHARLWAGVTIYYGVRIGDRVIIHSGAVLGADGFGMVTDSQGRWQKMLQLGAVTIGNDVEIGANTTIDRGTLDDTIIGNGVKLDNQIQIAHNVCIGENTIVAGCTGIAGSVTIGSHCIIAGAVSIADHVTIADRVILTGTTSVDHSIKQPGIYSSGVGVQPHAIWLRNVVRFRHLDTMAKQINELTKQVHDNGSKK